MNITSVVWLFPFAFLIHDIEEILTVKGFMRLNKDRITRSLCDGINTKIRYPIHNEKTLSLSAHSYENTFSHNYSSGCLHFWTL
ncbi:HXXEE domain-containing protein [Desulfosporosinus nitroreducens]|uniref:HXXEE domain-containing protein n=1 Tax=Desulfosporosinus nitroreducens TaxID=2018668 RepID=UPI003458C373